MQNSLLKLLVNNFPIIMKITYQKSGIAFDTCWWVYLYNKKQSQWPKILKDKNAYSLSAPNGTLCGSADDIICVMEKVTTATVGLLSFAIAAMTVLHHL